jgi:hypothetical protein
MLEFVTPLCIPDESMSEEECMEQRMSHVREILEEKIKERDSMRIQYPVFSV